MILIPNIYWGYHNVLPDNILEYFKNINNLAIRINLRHTLIF